MKTVILNDKYELGGGMGSWAKSRETVTVNEGDVRLIGGVLMSAYRVTRSPWWKLLGDCRDEVWWTPVDEAFNSFDNLRNWINRVTE